MYFENLLIGRKFMFSEKVKSWIRGNANKFDKDINLAIDAFEKVLEIDVKDKSIEALNSEILKTLEGLSNDNTQDFDRFCNIESFMKLVFRIINPKGLDTPPIKADYVKGNSWTLAPLFKQAFKLVPEDFNFNRGFKNSEYDEYYRRVYNYRNESSHGCEAYTAVEKCGFIQNHLIVYLKICFDNRNKINNAYKKCVIEKYIKEVEFSNEIITRYENKSKLGFTYIDIKWSKDDSNQVAAPIGKLIEETKGNVIKLLGEAGSGKTTAIEHLEYLDAKKIIENSNKRMPIFVKLSELSENKDNMLISRISDILNVPADIAVLLLECGLINLYLDGYNEILNVDVKKQFSRELDALIADYKNIKIVITDRAVVKSSIPVATKAEKYKLHPLSYEDIQEFIKNNSENPNVRDLLLDHLENNKEFYYDLNTPIKLKQFIQVTSVNCEIPNGDFIGSYIEYLFEREKDEKKDENIEYLNIFLQALSLFENDEFTKLKAEMQIAKCKRVFGYEVPDTKKCLNLSIEMGILTHSTENMLVFTTENYRNYFMYEALVNELDSILRGTNI
jgi:broad-specificity NMP kinase